MCPILDWITSYLIYMWALDTNIGEGGDLVRLFYVKILKHELYASYYLLLAHFALERRGKTGLRCYSRILTTPTLKWQWEMHWSVPKPNDCLRVIVFACQGAVQSLVAISVGVIRWSKIQLKWNLLQPKKKKKNLQQLPVVEFSESFSYI